jgi:signal transduction histidine kinase
VLLVEDNPDDAELVILELRRGGYQPVTRRVQTAADTTAALSEEQWDVVVSDYAMPGFTGPEAFAIMRKLNLDLPFIIVSGTIGEETAVEAMRAGVHDFLLKGHLRRLVVAIERELRDADMRAERARIQEQLLIANRMVSVGTLAAGAAHEINNPLSAVAGNLHVIKQDFEALLHELVTPSGATERAALIATASASFRQASADAEEGAERVRLIALDLRVFSHPDEDRRDSVDIQKVLESSIRMARNHLQGRARLVRDFGDVPKVLANEARLGQVFLNLVVNAAQAIAEGQEEHNAITVTTRYDGKMVTVDITDTGSGIGPEILPRIFDVFFTTKKVGVGTGLGLSICHRIVTALGGRIEVKSQAGKGTTFRVSLVPSTIESSDAVAAQTMSSPPEGRRAAVLVVEDEPALGRVLPRLLAQHQVTVVTRAREALARIAAGEVYDTILCDLMMPEMTGMEFYDALLQLRPDLVSRIVFMSGGTFNPGTRAFLERIPNHRIDKPIDTANLRRLVGQSLADSSA